MNARLTQREKQYFGLPDQPSSGLDDAWKSDKEIKIDCY